jgi:hypothetical protein
MSETVPIVWSGVGQRHGAFPLAHSREMRGGSINGRNLGASRARQRELLTIHQRTLAEMRLLALAGRLPCAQSILDDISVWAIRWLLTFRNTAKGKVLARPALTAIANLSLKQRVIGKHN